MPTEDGPRGKGCGTADREVQVVWTGKPRILNFRILNLGSGEKEYMSIAVGHSPCVLQASYSQARSEWGPIR